MMSVLSSLLVGLGWPAEPGSPTRCPINNFRRCASEALDEHGRQSRSAVDRRSLRCPSRRRCAATASRPVLAAAALERETTWWVASCRRGIRLHAGGVSWASLTPAWLTQRRRAVSRDSRKAGAIRVGLSPSALINWRVERDGYPRWFNGPSAHTVQRLRFSGARLFDRFGPYRIGADFGSSRLRPTSNPEIRDSPIAAFSSSERRSGCEIQLGGISSGATPSCLCRRGVGPSRNPPTYERLVRQGLGGTTRREPHAADTDAAVSRRHPGKSRRSEISYSGFLRVPPRFSSNAPALCPHQPTIAGED